MSISRREFIKRAAAVSVTAASAPYLGSLLMSSGCAPAIPKGLSEEQIAALLKKALNKGGDFSEVYIEDVASLSLKMSEGICSSAQINIAGGAGIRTVDGEKTGYAFINGNSFNEALSAAEEAAWISTNQYFPEPGMPHTPDIPDNVSVVVPVNTISEADKIELITAAEVAARDYSPYIKQVDITYYDQTKKRTIASSDGLRISNEIPLIWLVVEVLAERNGARHKGRTRISAHQGFEFFDTESAEAAAISAATEAVTMLDAKPSPSGEMPVIMYPGWGGVLIHEAVGHGLEGDFIYKGTSIYADKLGKKVGSDVVTMVDDSSWPNARGTTVFDDEGTIGRKNVLIKDGILLGFMHDKISAKKLEMEPTGNGRRQSYHYIPQPRMTNTYLDNGSSTPEQIFADTKRGLFVKALSGGSVDVISGQFNFIVREAYMVENGEVTYPVSGATLIGRGIDVLTNIDAVANDLKLGNGTCGKEQWVPVTSGVPTMRVARGIKVGGSA